MLLVLVTLVIAYVGLCVLVFLSQKQLVFPVPPGAREPELPGATLLRIPRPEGSTVYALHVPAPEGAPTVVHFHGNGVQLADEAWLAQRFQEAGLGLYAVEYPGYGLAGDPFDNAAKASGLELPVLIVHGTRDEIIPVDMGRRLGSLFPRATVRLLEGRTHNDVLDQPSVLRELMEFARGGARKADTGQPEP